MSRLYKEGDRVTIRITPNPGGETPSEALMKFNKEHANRDIPVVVENLDGKYCVFKVGNFRVSFENGKETTTFTAGSVTVVNTLKKIVKQAKERKHV